MKNLMFTSWKLALGNTIAFGFPSFANLSILGPPGYPSPKALATLSYASPAASSLV